MLTLEVLMVFIAASIALDLAPGPDNIFVLTQSALYGRLAGLIVTLGLCTGLLLHTTAVALGVAVIFQTSALAFTLLKIVGALYLLYLAWGAYRAGASKWEDGGKARADISFKKLYMRGIMMSTTNPKLAIFFLAFLPQFADPARGSITAQIFMLGAVFLVIALMVFSAIAWGAGFLGNWLKQSPGAQKLMNRMASFVFVALAIRLATAER